MSEKKKIGFYWCGACGGCEVSVLDIDEMILDVVEQADIVFWPCAMDLKYSDVEDMEDDEMDFIFINGSIRSEENEELVKLLRKKSKNVVAYGSCSSIGGLFGLGNLYSREELLQKGYVTVSTEGDTIPQKKSEVEEGELELPELNHHVVPLKEVIEVDYFLPGCPPLPNQLEEAFPALLDDDVEVGKYDLISEKSVCDVCPLDREEKRIDELKPIQEVDLNPDECILDQGVLCMGPATAGMCDAPCPDVGHPCIGCNGPVRGVADQGGRMASALASVIAIEGEEKRTEKEVHETMKSVRDPTGSFYRFSLPSSILQFKRGDSDE
ncbi:MAG: oxidoreductase [Candidatus Saliniplasma sp.]